MPYLSPKQQSLRDTRQRKEVADRSFNVLTNTPILNLNPKGVFVEGLTTKQKTELAKLSFEDFQLMCENAAIRRMMARLLETNDEILKDVCKSANGVKKQIDTSLLHQKEKRRANTLPIKNVVPKFLMAISAKPSKARTIIDILPRDIILNVKKEFKKLLKYELREWVPADKLNSSLSKNYNAIDYLKKNENLIDYKILSANTNPDAIELLRIQIEKDTNSIDWEELSKNPNAIELLLDNEKKINWVAFCCNPSPRMIAILKKKIDENPFNIELYRNWSSLSSNTSNEAIAYLKENFNNIHWGNLSGNTNLDAIELLRNQIEKDPNSIDWDKICSNEKAMDIIVDTLRKEPYLIRWASFSCNTSNEAINIIKNLLIFDPDYVSWTELSRNSSAIKILLANKEKIVWSKFSSNTNIINPDAIELLKKKIEEDEIKRSRNKLDWSELSANPSIFVLS
jgi:hypothetical protein